MDFKQINNKHFIECFTEYRHRKTSKAISEKIQEELKDGKITESLMNPLKALELATIYKHEFSNTNIKEIKEFVQDNFVELSENKFKAFFTKLFNRKLEIEVDIDELTNKVLNNYDKLTELTSRFLDSLGYSDGVQNYYRKNCEDLKELGGELICDYFYNKNTGFKPELLMNKHIYHIFSELGEDYNNITRKFQDIDKLKFEDGKVILPSQAILIQGSTFVDITDGYGGGYEITALLKDKDYVKALEEKFKTYVNMNSMELMERYYLEEDGVIPPKKQKFPKVN
ncbi:TPA: hypothetical protein NIE67_000733 [Pseudomonas aeruginosa]|nr:hypothetical protein [Pseudomonas aeruginosa]